MNIQSNARTLTDHWGLPRLWLYRQGAPLRGNPRSSVVGPQPPYRLVKKRSGRYPRLAVDGHGSSVVPNAGAVLLLRTAEAVGLDLALSRGVGPWRRPLARHDPGKILLDLAVSLAVGGDCLADLALLRSAPEVFGPVASDPTVSRWKIAWPPMPRPRWPQSPRPARPRGRPRGHWPASTRLTRTRAPLHRWSSTWTPPWSPRIRRRSPRRRRSSAGSASIRCGRSSITGPRGPGSRWRSPYGRATPGPTPWSTTSLCCAPRWPSCPAAAGRARTC